MYNAIKKILEENGKCLLIENGKPIGVVLTMADYEKLSVPGTNSENKTEKTLFSENTPPQTPPYQGGDKGDVVVPNPIGEVLAQEMDYPEVSADIADIEATDDVTLEDLGLDELPY